MLAQSHAQPDTKRTKRLVKRIINWATDDVSITNDKSQLEDLTSRLGSEVVDRAVELSLDLRRQYRLCRIRFPIEPQVQFSPQEEMTALPGSPADSKSSQNVSEPGTIRIFPKPGLEKGEWLPSASMGQDSEVLVEGEFVEFSVDRTPFNANRGTSFVGKHFSSQDRHSEKCVMM
jgi:hypothetical protein